MENEIVRLKLNEICNKKTVKKKRWNKGSVSQKFYVLIEVSWIIKI